jgi:asparagine synthase (glutamine-hydrolysing)
MCGIAGMFDRSGRQPAQEGALRQMLGMLRHRGPDEFGILLDREAGLGNARLSIIDLSGGTQPIGNEDESLWIVFNGEIFNYLELREGLVARGCRFRTSSDTEVVLHLFEEFGPGCLDQLNGQFAIAIWDSRRRCLFLARDRLGVRPLFYTQLADGTLLFASEIKSILSDDRVAAEIDPQGLAQVFMLWSTLTPGTAFRGIRELPPGHFLVASQDGLQVERYWENRFPPQQEVVSWAESSRPFEKVVEEFRALLIDACRIRLRAEVPVGAYLSGGIDSSTIASIVRRHMPNRLVTFSIAFGDEQFDESVFQLEMARHLGTDHHVVRASHADIGRVFPKVVWHAETPLMRTAPAPMFLLSELVHQTGFKVVLTGEGADEVLAGYDIFKEAAIRRFWAAQPGSRRRPLLFQRLYGDIKGFSQSSPAFLAAFFGEGLADIESPWYSHAIRWRNNQRTWRFFAEGLMPSSEAACLGQMASRLPAGFHDWQPLARAQFLETSYLLSSYLLSSQGDRMAMAHSVEGRFPFLDVRLVEFCNRLPAAMKLRVLQEKYLLRQAASPWLPEAIWRRPKRPYRAPVHRSFFNEKAPDYVRELLHPQSLRASGFFKPAAVEQLVHKIDASSAIGQTDDMALAGILSTLLLHQQFVTNFRKSKPLDGNDAIKICKTKSILQRVAL